MKSVISVTLKPPIDPRSGQETTNKWQGALTQFAGGAMQTTPQMH